MKRILFLFALFCLPVTGAQASSLEVGLNDFSAHLQYFQTINQDAYGTSQMGARVLYNDHKDTKLACAGVDFLGRPGNIPGLDVGVGAQVYAGRVGTGSFEQDLAALGIGARANFNPPMLGGVGLGARFFFAPNILSFADSERLFETAVRASYAVTPKVRIVAEYQDIHAKFENLGTGAIDEGLRIGFEAQF